MRDRGIAFESNDWRLIVLQITLGPVLEEVVLRGYLFTLLT